MLPREKKQNFSMRVHVDGFMTQIGGTFAQIASPGMPPYTRKLLAWSFSIGIIPPVVLIAAVSTKSLYLLDYVHVICGGTWTGFDIFMGVVMTRIMRSLDLPARVEVAKRLTPTTFFILPSLAATAITAGIYLAQSEAKFDMSSLWIIVQE